MYKIPMIFPGQASQVVGMGRDLAEGEGPAADFLGQVNGVLGDDLTEIMFQGPNEVLTETRNAQPAILAHSVAVTLALRQMDILPSIVAGHSLGEFSAAVACGSLDPFDALRTVRKRGELMYAAGREIPGTMAAVLGLPSAQVIEICSRVSSEVGVVVLANHNSQAQVAISGEVAAVAAARKALEEAGARRVIPLNVDGAFHSPLLEGAAAEFEVFLSEIAISDPVVPLVANVTALDVTDAAVMRHNLGRQLTSPVLWHDTMQRITNGAEPRPKVVLEIGPSRVLTNMAKRAFPEVKFYPVGTPADLDGVLDFLAAQDVPDRPALKGEG